MDGWIDQTKHADFNSPPQVAGCEALGQAPWPLWSLSSIPDLGKTTGYCPKLFQQKSTLVNSYIILVCCYYFSRWIDGLMFEDVRCSFDAVYIRILFAQRVYNST